MKVESSSVVELDVTTRRLPEGEVIESTLGRDPITVHLGRGDLAPGIERELIGMASGEEKTIEIGPEDGYGPILAENIHRRRRGDFPSEVELKPGMRFAAKLLEGGGRVEFAVREIAGDEVVIDFNHPFAGQRLKVWFLVRGIRTPNAEEAAETETIKARRAAARAAGSGAPGAEVSAVKPAAAASATATKPTAQSAASSASEPSLVTIEDVARLGLRAGVVREAQRVQGADRLLQLRIDLGHETRTLVAGIAASYTPEALIGRSIIVVTNLKPAKIRGIESRGMLLAGVDADGKPMIATFEAPLPPGAEVR
jgi:methionine--tRNA ligase beta chain